MQQGLVVDQETFAAEVVVLGETGVGKTSLVHQYIEGTFDDVQATTIGASFQVKNLNIGKTTVSLQIWDTAGQERFRSMASMYYRNATAAILVYDLTAPATFQQLRTWVDELKQHVNEDIVLAIAANKGDLARAEDERLRDPRAYARKINAMFFVTSAKTGMGTCDMFDSVGRRIYRAHDDAGTLDQIRERTPSYLPAPTIDTPPARTQERTVCC